MEPSMAPCGGTNQGVETPGRRKADFRQVSPDLRNPRLVFGSGVVEEQPEHGTGMGHLEAQATGPIDDGKKLVEARLRQKTLVDHGAGGCRPADKSRILKLDTSAQGHEDDAERFDLAARIARRLEVEGIDSRTVRVAVEAQDLEARQRTQGLQEHSFAVGEDHRLVRIHDAIGGTFGVDHQPGLDLGRQPTTERRGYGLDRGEAVGGRRAHAAADGDV